MHAQPCERGANWLGVWLASIFKDPSFVARFSGEERSRERGPLFFWASEFTSLHVSMVSTEPTSLSVRVCSSKVAINLAASVFSKLRFLDIRTQSWNLALRGMNNKASNWNQELWLFCLIVLATNSEAPTMTKKKFSFCEFSNFYTCIWGYKVRCREFYPWTKIFIFSFV